MRHFSGQTAGSKVEGGERAEATSQTDRIRPTIVEVMDFESPVQTLRGGVYKKSSCITHHARMMLTRI
mgnify:CR=1 FL=1|jgi:hypothetical protein